MCVCHLVAPFTAHCNVTILQHPHEKLKHYNTARIVNSVIENSQLVRGVIFDDQFLATLQNAYLLFPGQGAVDCAEFLLTQQHQLLVLDGTWSEAGKIFLRNSVIRALPKISFTAPLRSNYRIRKQPKSHCLSTIEAVGHALMINAGTLSDQAQQIEYRARYQTLFKAFDLMVDGHLEAKRTARETGNVSYRGTEPKRRNG